MVQIFRTTGLSGGGVINFLLIPKFNISGIRV
jgi:hypothetical protein